MLAELEVGRKNRTHTQPNPFQKKVYPTQPNPFVPNPFPPNATHIYPTQTIFCRIQSNASCLIHHVTLCAQNQCVQTIKCCNVLKVTEQLPEFCRKLSENLPKLYPTHSTQTHMGTHPYPYPTRPNPWVYPTHFQLWVNRAFTEVERSLTSSDTRR